MFPLCVWCVCCVCVVYVLCVCCVCVVYVLCVCVVYMLCCTHVSLCMCCVCWSCTHVALPTRLIGLVCCTSSVVHVCRMPSDHFVGTVLIKINNVFLLFPSPSRKCARLLQAVRWKLSRTRPRAQRKKLLKLYINTDILGCTATATRMVRSARFNDKYLGAV